MPQVTRTEQYLKEIAHSLDKIAKDLEVFGKRGYIATPKKEDKGADADGSGEAPVDSE